MSFDLIFWYQKTLPTLAETARVCDDSVDGSIGIAEERPAVEDFLRAAFSKYPCLSEKNTVLLDLARTRGLTAYVSQDRVIYAIAGDSSSR